MGLIGIMFKTYRASSKSREKIVKLQNKRLKKLVKYARNNSSYFEELYKDIGNNFELKDFYQINTESMLFDNSVALQVIALQNKLEEYQSNKDK